MAPQVSHCGGDSSAESFLQGEVKNKENSTMEEGSQPKIFRLWGPLAELGCHEFSLSIQKYH